VVYTPAPSKSPNAKKTPSKPQVMEQIMSGRYTARGMWGERRKHRRKHRRSEETPEVGGTEWGIRMG
jgi:hypothetical protein